MILCCGEALIGMLPCEPAFTPRAGGAAFNTDQAACRARVGRADIARVSDEDLRWLQGEGEIADLAGKILRSGANPLWAKELT